MASDLRRGEFSLLTFLFSEGRGGGGGIKYFKRYLFQTPLTQHSDFFNSRLKTQKGVFQLANASLSFYEYGVFWQL